MEVYAGEKSTQRLRRRTYGCREETLEAVREYSVAIKGPMTTPVGGGIRSLNVALRQELDLYVCLRPVRYFRGVPSPLKDPSGTDMVIFRENTEDIYAGIEWEAESEGARKVIAFLQDEMGVRKIRFPETSGIGDQAGLARGHASGSCAARSSTRSSTAAARSRSCTRATS